MKTKKDLIENYGSEVAAILEVIVRNQRSDGYAYLTYSKISKQTGMTVKRVTKYVHALRGANVGNENIITTVHEDGRQQAYAVRSDLALCF